VQRRALAERDTLLAAVQTFRAGLVEEFGQYDRREREARKLRKGDKRGSGKKAGRR